jgi:hypothetical protein
LAVVCAGALVAAVPWAGAVVIQPRSLDELVGAADGVYQGIVTDKTCAWNEDHTAIVTHYRLEVSSTWVGAPTAELILTERGGEIDGLGLMVPGTPSYRVGEQVVVFTHRGNGRLMTLFWTQGKFTLRQLPAGSAADGGEESAEAERMAVQAAGLVPSMPVAELKNRVTALAAQGATP